MSYQSIVQWSLHVWLLPAALLVVLPAQAQSTTDVPTVAAASDLQFALEDIAARFRADTKLDVKLVFGSSGNFYRQIEQGAPFQLFMSADEGFIFKLADLGRVEDRGALYAVGRIVLFAPHQSSFKPDAQFKGLKSALTNDRIKRFAIANPEHAPYGRAAEQTLRKLGLWSSLQPKLVLGENVSQAAQFATSGSADGGIFAFSLALSPAVSKLGSYVLIPAETHDPLRQRMALVKGANISARTFYNYLQQSGGREIFKRYGFVLPSEI